MKLRNSFVLVPCLFLMSCVTNGGASVSNNGWGVDVGTILNSESLGKIIGNVSSSDLTNIDIVRGLKEALSISSAHVAGKLGAFDGFNRDPQIRIPLPDTLQKVDSALSLVGMNSLTNDLELRLNRAAEVATPKAKALFLSAIKNMTIDDARSILGGQQDAATQYLRRSMGGQLEQEMQPLIQSALSHAGAIQAYDRVVDRYAELPLVSGLSHSTKAQLTDYVTDKAMSGIFYYVAQEEAAIRANPAKRTSEILQRVFGSRQ